MEERKLAQNDNLNQGLLDALESLSAALSVVSISVDMVREELQEVLSMLALPVAGERSDAGESPRHPVLPFETPIASPNLTVVSGEPEISVPPIFFIDGAVRPERKARGELRARVASAVGA